MQCPKCQNIQDETLPTCLSCGLVFAKYERYLERKKAVADNTDRGSFNWQSLLFPPQAISSKAEIIAKATLLLILLIYSLVLITSGLDISNGTDRFIHLPNLIFHEAGHVIFGIFGQFIGSAGGTLGQLIMPLIFFYAFLIQQRNIFSAAVILWWFAENFIDIAPYVNDASLGVMPLLGGNTGQTAPYGFHDWEYLLTELGLIKFDHCIAWAFHSTGSLLMLLALLWAGWAVKNQYNSKD